MKHLPTLGLALGFLVSTGAVYGQDQWTRLSMSSDSIGQWRFFGGDWKQNAEGVINSPGKFEQHHLAFLPETAYGNLEAEFEFRRDSNHGGVGLMVRAQDPRRYYVIQFPFCGQQAREGHFWASILRFDETGWGKVLVEERVPGIPAESGLWQQARVSVQGQEIRVRVNGRPLPVVRDAAHPAVGRLGLMNWGPTSLRNLRVRGTKAKAAAWDERRQPARPWYNPYPTSDKRQGTPGLTRVPNGDLLMVVNNSVVRSTDLGRTWQSAWGGQAAAAPPVFEKPGSEPEALMGIGTLARTPDGQVILVRVRNRKPFRIEVARSKDSGKTWSSHEPVGEVKLPEVIKEAYMYGQILELRDKALLFFGHTYHPHYELLLVEGRRYRQAPVPGMKSFCMRSEDGGRTWSDPVDIDGPNPQPKIWMSYKDGPSEVTAMETREGEIVAFLRPGTGWAMWETRSKDGGRSWTPLSAGPFLMYACAGTPRATASGALVIGGRHPGLGIRVSRDNGMTWETYQIDTENWAMGGMYEVAPDEVLWVYGSGNDKLRAQRIRITPRGVEPVPPLASK